MKFWKQPHFMSNDINLMLLVFQVFHLKNNFIAFMICKVDNWFIRVQF